MNTRERLKATFEFLPVDRPLLFYEGEPEVDERLTKHFNTNNMENVLVQLDVDFRRVVPKYIGPEIPKLTDGCEQDIWGIIRKPVNNPTGVYMEVVHYPWQNMAR